jgi:hypothetical protein
MENVCTKQALLPEGGGFWAADSHISNSINNAGSVNRGPLQRAMLRTEHLVGLKESVLGLHHVETEGDDDDAAARASPAAAAASAGAAAAGFPLHRAAFEGDAAALNALLRRVNASPEDLEVRDPHGHTPLHCAALSPRRAPAAAAALVAAGARAEARSARGWTPLDEAIAAGDRSLVLAILPAALAEAKADRLRAKPRLLAAMRALPDFEVRLSWHLGSPLFGLLLRAVAPEDTYTLTKRGLRLRLDGALRGIDKSARSSVLPRWRRAPFSLLVDAAVTPVRARLADHADGTYVDLAEERRAASHDLERDADDLLAAGGATRVRLKPGGGGGGALRPRRGWLGGPEAAEVGGWPTRAFDAGGEVLAVVLTRAPPAEALPAGCSYAEYLAAALPADGRREVPWEPLAPPPAAVKKRLAAAGAAAGGAAASAAAAADADADADADAAEASATSGKKKHGRRVAARLWLAEGFPLALADLIPVLEAVGAANKHIAAAARFVGGLPKGAFPLKMKVPLVYTVHGGFNAAAATF